ncbi:MAG: TonB-dependent receptor [Phaeodactylibacter sp.]|nr:TonB-dependent receptor [Phaeodactylibacter sp.]MCB9277082.1 TonB-dependent receptor [Lewinellaceae bacterium]
MKLIFTLLFALLLLGVQAQSAAIRGQLQDDDKSAIVFANVALYNAADSSLAKVEASDEAGIFAFKGMPAGDYYIIATHVGSADLERDDISLSQGQQLDLGVLSFAPAVVELKEATVTASRMMVEIKPDRTVFNVEGTVNSTGADGLSLLRKAPGVTVDNNDNINVLGRSGVLLYVDGKRLPLAGQDLSNYLQNLPAEQIDRIDIITNPGARYEAEGNAGIIDIRLKKDKRLGANGSVSATFSQGQYHRSNLNASGNYRNGFMNVFGNAGTGDGGGFMNMDFLSYQNGLALDEINNHRNTWKYHNYRIGADFFLGEKNTIGFLVDARRGSRTHRSFNRISIADQSNPALIDSILVAYNTGDYGRQENTYNLNYRFDNRKGRSLNVDVDYGTYNNDSERYQPNRYYDAKEEVLLTEAINSFDTPSDIDIYTFKVDYEEELWGGKLGAGSKLSRVVSDNTFLFYDVENGDAVQNNRRSNRFQYEENVYAGYLNYARPIGEKLNVSAGLRAEQTDATGNLQAFLAELQEPPVEFNYLSWFPNAGLSWQLGQKHVLALNYGRRINRPDYNVLNPFNNQISQLSYEKGNPFLRPEIVNNLELGYTLASRYHVKLAYSRTTGQITRLIAPDDEDPRAGFITWANLAEQSVYSFNFSAPVQIMKGWNAYFNLSASHLDNQADYGNGAVVDVQAFTYNIYQQHTFNLPAGFLAEVSGYYSGPGIWGGVFKYDPNWSLDIGLQRKFFNDKLNARLTVSDIFYETGWSGVSEFNGLVSSGSGAWDSRRASLSLSYRFGNENVKSRRRNTGLQEEAGRVGGGE